MMWCFHECNFIGDGEQTVCLKHGYYNILQSLGDGQFNVYLYKDHLSAGLACARVL